MKIDSKISIQYSDDVYKTGLQLFIESNAEIIEQLLDADTETRFLIIHKLKGGATMLGLIDISKDLDKAEQNLNDDEIIKSIIKNYQHIKSYYENL